MSKPFHHPNLSDGINKAINDSEAAGGFYLKDLPANKEMRVQTKNTLYQIRNDPEQPGQFLIRGHALYCPDWTHVGISGSTWGGSMLKLGFVGLGMHLEYHTSDGDMAHAVITTSQIREITVV